MPVMDSAAAVSLWNAQSELGLLAQLVWLPNKAGVNVGRKPGGLPHGKQTPLL